MRCFYTTPPPSIPPEQLASETRQVSCQSGSLVNFKYPAAGQWIPPSLPPTRSPEQASGSRPVSRPPLNPAEPEQLSGCRPVSRTQVDPAEYPARQWVAPRILPEPVHPAQYPARQWIPLSKSSWPVDAAQYPARKWILLSIPPERLSSGSRRVSRQSGSPVDPAKYPAAGARKTCTFWQTSLLTNGFQCHGRQDLSIGTHGCNESKEKNREDRETVPLFVLKETQKDLSPT